MATNWIQLSLDKLKEKASVIGKVIPPVQAYQAVKQIQTPEWKASTQKFAQEYIRSPEGRFFPQVTAENIARGFGITPQTEEIQRKMVRVGWKGLSPEEQKIVFAPAENLAWFGAVAPTPIRGLGSKIVKKSLSDFIRKAKPLERRQAELYTKARGERIARLRTIETAGQRGFYERLATQKGELPKLPRFEPPKFTQGVKDELHDLVRLSDKLSDIEKIPAGRGLDEIFEGKIPVRSSIAKLEKVFGADFAKNLTRLETRWQKLGRITGEVVGIPRSLMAGGFDMSFGLRQGVFAGWRHPKQWATSFKKQFGWFLKDENVAKNLAEIRSRPTYPLMERARIDITDLGSKREEQFISSLAEKIPGVGKFVRASGRAYTGFASRYRADIFDYYIKNRQAMKLPIDEQYLASLGRWVNSSTGRGHLGKLEPVAKEAATALFSPRHFKSIMDRFNPAFYAKLHPSVRKEAIKTLSAFVGGIFTTLFLADQIPGADVEWKEPTSANFLKIRVGNTKIDIMGGMQQPIVLAARLLENKLVSTTTGKTIYFGEGYKPLTRWDMLQSFAENKTTPVLSFLIGALKGRTSIGEPFLAGTEAARRMVPIFLQDMRELVLEGDIDLIPLAGPMAFFGAGVQTYGPKDGTPAEIQVKREEDERSILDKLFGHKEVGAAELPTNPNDLKVLYEDAQKTIKDFPDVSSKIRTGLKTTQTLLEAENELQEAKDLIERIESERPEEAADLIYYDFAKESFSSRSLRVSDEVGRITAEMKDRTELMSYLVSLRREVDGKRVLTSDVIDDLFNDGVISSDEKRLLKNTKWKDGKPTIKMTGRGRKAALKKVTPYKTKKLKIRSMRALLQTKKRGKITTKKYKFRRTL